ncbi:MAG: hypothetical protein Q9163_002851 [Psora crenata]
MATTTPLSLEERDTKIFIDGIITTILGTPSTKFRPVDFLHGRHRERPMRVLCLSYSRTGTLDMSIALETLGFRAYHLAEVSQNPTHFPCWRQAQEAKYYGKGKAWGKEEFEKMLAGHDVREVLSAQYKFGSLAVLDIPCLNFAEELITMYPDAKVILSEVPADEWVASMSRSAGYVVSWRSWPLIAWADPILVKPWWDYMRSTDRVIGWTDPSRARANYLAHNAAVRRACPKERLLEFTPGKSGWEELCTFLGKEVPAGTPFPKVPDEQFFVGVHIFYLIRAAKLATGKVALAAAPIVVLAAAAAAWGFEYSWPFRRWFT